MTTVNHLPVQALALLGFGYFIVSAIFLLGLIKAFTNKVGKSLTVAFAILFVVSLLLMQSIVEVFEISFMEYKMDARAAFISECPYAAVAVILSALAGFELLLWIILQRRIHSMLTPFSLQEGLDQMSDGICFSTLDGVPLLVNKKMQDISYLTFGTGILDTINLREKYLNGNIQPGCEISKIGNNSFLKLADGTVWNIVENKVAVKSKTLNEYIAYDVTQQYQKSLELEERNAHLSEINRQLKEYSQNLDSIIREREILTAKIKLHDDVGRSLLALRSYLVQENGNREGLIALWRSTISILKHEAVASEQDSRIEALSKAAQAVNVELNIDGNIPAKQRIEKIVVFAVHECLTNTVKHAGGSRLDVKIREHSDCISLEITNDGTPPDGKITERGGLKSLRAAVEMNGGVMEIISSPEFVLRINIRKEKEYE